MWNITPQFAAAHTAHREAWATYEAFVGKGDETSPEATAAEAREEQLLDEFICFPASTPTEIAVKMNYMRERDIDIRWAEARSRNLRQIERDLIQMQRPCVSPQVAAAFEIWVEANAAIDAVPDDETTALCHKAAAAFQVMAETPCTSPGDFMLKAYADYLDSWGPNSPVDDAGWFAFELNATDPVDLIDGNSDIAYAKALVRDINDTDLGRCLQALGRVDFDAEAWVAATKRCGQHIAVVTLENDQTLSLIMPVYDAECDQRTKARRERCRELLGAGLGVIRDERIAAVIAHLFPAQGQAA